MPATNTCFGMGWKFDSNGKPALNASAASALIGNVGTGEVSVNVDPLTTQITGTAPGKIGDKLHHASGSGGGSFPNAPIGQLGNMSSIAATGSSGTLGGSGFSIGNAIANPFTSSVELTLWGFSDMYVFAQDTADCNARLDLQFSANGGANWGTVQSLWVICIQGLAANAYSAATVPFKVVMAAGASVTPMWRILYSPTVGQANAAAVNSVSYTWDMHRV